VRGKSGRVENGAITRLAGSITDIDAVKKSRAEIESLAFYDQLTSLPNRAKAAELAEQAIRLVGEGKTCSLILIDIDDFKTVNDTYGHEIGDKIILFMAKELSSLCDENIAVSRIGGDEFTVFAALTSADATERLAKLAVRLVSRKIEIDGRFHYPTASAGIALYPDHGKHFIELLGKADAALAIAKKAGKGCVHIFNDAIQRKLIARRQLEAGLRGAIENKELSTAFQPQMDVQTGRISGFEALARWNSDSYGPVSPAEFIPLAEETGMVDRIGMFVLSSALDFIKRADLMGRHDFSVSVNVSPMQLLDDNFVPRVLRMIDEAHVSANRVSLEITESVLIVGLEETVAKLNRIRQSGIKISLDDFGKGYSSLLYLKELPIDCVKIDKAFVDDILSEEKTKVLARNIVTIAHQLGFTVVAEGVETGDQLEYLKDCECDSIQGYFFSKPKTRDDALSQLGQMDLRG
jgi:diguanylate cyclase (GGDEF)-like protein